MWSIVQRVRCVRRRETVSGYGGGVRLFYPIRHIYGAMYPWRIFDSFSPLECYQHCGQGCTTVTDNAISTSQTLVSGTLRKFPRDRIFTKIFFASINELLVRSQPEFRKQKLFDSQVIYTVVRLSCVAPKTGDDRPQKYGVLSFLQSGWEE